MLTFIVQSLLMLAPVAIWLVIPLPTDMQRQWDKSNSNDTDWNF